MVEELTDNESTTPNRDTVNTTEITSAVGRGRERGAEGGVEHGGEQGVGRDGRGHGGRGRGGRGRGCRGQDGRGRDPNADPDNGRWKSEPQARRRFEFEGEPGIKVQPEDLTSPFSVFKMFYSEELVENVTAFTNRYAEILMNNPQIQERTATKHRSLF